jgi:hypothetical protein
MKQPLPLSVVIITVEGPERLRTCLQALQRQTGEPTIEVLAPWDGRHGSSSALNREFPDVQFIFAGGGTHTFAQLRSLGIRQARGNIVAITEDHFTPAPNWCQEILSAHRSPHAAIGGAVEKQTPDTTLNWAFYLADYLRYLDPTEGPSANLTDGNVTYKRAALDPIRGIWAEEFHENVVHAALQNGGESLWLSPRISVRQKRDISLAAAVRDRYAFGRLFGSTRVEGASAARRLKLTLTSVLLPPLLVVRIAAHILRTRRYAGAFLRSFPAILLISTVWAWGEFMGYVTARPEDTLDPKPS